MEIEMNCIICGKKTIARNKTRRYCDGCARDVENEKKRKRNKLPKNQATIKAYSKNYYEGHAEERKEYSRKWGKKNKEKRRINRLNFEEKNPDYKKKYNAKYYEENKEKESLRMKRYHERNRDKILARFKEYREKNREYFRKHNKRYQIENREKISENKKRNWLKKREYYRELSKKYYQSPRGKEMMKKNTQLRRARKKNIVHDFTYEEWKNKLEKTKGICPKCKKYVGTDKLSLDHILPISLAFKGQSYSIDMVDPLCFSCNSSKGKRFKGENFMKMISNIAEEDDETIGEILNVLKEMIEWMDEKRL